VHRIAINTAISYQRYSRMREVGQVIQRIGRPTLPPDPGSVAERSDVFNALRKLPPKQAAAIVLRHHHGYTNREIAAALEIPERTVASRLIAAKARLRQILDSEPRKGPRIDMSTLSEDGVPSE
jgi:RNA polymerase sigma factor (sigma-70 family)